VICNGLLYRYQSGFRSAHIITTALLNVTDSFRRNCERGLVTSSCTTSLIFRFESSAVSLIKPYPNGRFQCVCVGDELSGLAPVLKGVVKGLAPYSLFINDLMNVIMLSHCHMYANNVQLYISGEWSDLTRTIEKLDAQSVVIGIGQVYSNTKNLLFGHLPTSYHLSYTNVWLYHLLLNKLLSFDWPTVCGSRWTLALDLPSTSLPLTLFRHTQKRFLGSCYTYPICCQMFKFFNLSSHFTYQDHRSPLRPFHFER
jgi:hypothetical protein